MQSHRVDHLRYILNSYSGKMLLPEPHDKLHFPSYPSFAEVIQEPREGINVNRATSQD